MAGTSELDLALVEMGFEFGRVSQKQLDPDARDLFVTVFHEAIGPDIVDGTISWANPDDREFVLDKVRELAGKLPDDPVTADALIDVAGALLPQWQATCQRPGVKETLGPPCTVAAAVIAAAS